MLRHTDSPDFARATHRAISHGARSPRVAILGAGAAGLCLSIQLLHAGIRTFEVYEKSDGVGGTWRDNTYPGAGCDVPSHLYSFSFAAKRDWSRKYAQQPEILEYLESLVDRFELKPHLRFGVEVTSATWEDETSVWQLRFADGNEVEVDVIVSGLGQLNRPYIPAIPGLDSFNGPLFHSARWNHETDLRQQRVGVIGIGASAIQFVPPVAAEAATVTLFQRTANYVAPKNDREFTPWERRLFKYLPGAQRVYRFGIYCKLEARWSFMRRRSRLGALMQKKFATQLAPLASDRLTSEALIPEYVPGCRRILISDDWYPTLLKKSVSVETTGVERITASGVVTSDGTEHPLDVLIFGTGFTTTEFLAPIEVTGRHGKKLSDVWESGARAFLGLAVPEFPNLFLLYGPNTNLGHNSILFMIEQQVQHIVGLLQRMVVERIEAVEPSAVAMENFDSFIEGATARTVWAEDCSSWYKNASGRVTNNWPAPTVSYRRLLKRGHSAEWLTSTLRSDP